MRASESTLWAATSSGSPDQPPPAATPAAPPIKVLPNHDVVALGELPLGDRMTLSDFADLTAERVWRLSEASMLAGIANGRHIDDLLHVLDHASDQGLPATVITLIADVRARCAALTDQGMVRLVECRDAATAVLIAREFALRAALAHLRHVLPPGSSASHLGQSGDH